MKRKRAALLPNNLALLINLLKRDPESYKEEFLSQLKHYEAQYNIFLVNPHAESEMFCDLVDFMSHAAPYYPKELSFFPKQLEDLLTTHHADLDFEVREKIIKCFILLRNRNVISAVEFFDILFPLLCVATTKYFRHQLFSAIVNDIRYANKKSVNTKLNKHIQSKFFDALSDTDTACLWTTRITRELWKKNVWRDARTVEIMRLGAMKESTLQAVIISVRFFLSQDQEEDDDSDSSDSEVDIGRLKHQMTINKKKKSRSNVVEKAKSKAKKKNAEKETVHLNFAAIHLLRDPQTFAEELYSKYVQKKSTFKEENRIVVLNLVCRLVGAHKLVVLGLYTFLLPYLTPRKRDVTQYLAYTAQASHEFVPSDLLETIMKKIANEFVSEGVSAEVAAAGLNTIREICARAPDVISEELLHDLSEYKNSKDKGVIMAARSLISLFREIHPEMLRRKDRGKEATVKMLEKKKPAPVDLDSEDSASEEDDDEVEELVDEEDGEDEEGEVEDGEEGETPGIINYADEVVDPDALPGVTKYKFSKEERLAKAKEGREGREKYSSRKGKISHPHSTTNKEKSKKKNFVMMQRKSEVRGKAKRSLRQQQIIMRRHVANSKRK